jgi:zinc transport system ATP-binding protein
MTDHQPASEIAVEYRNVTFRYPWSGASVGASMDTPGVASNGASIGSSGRPSGVSGSSRGDTAPEPALSDVTFSVSAGERLGILGPNGGGKSTLIKLTLGLLSGASGSIRVLGCSPDEARGRGLIGYVPQKVGVEPAFPLNVRQVVAMPLESRLPPWRSLSASQRERVDRTLEMVGASDLADRHIGSLSGGQMQRVMIARALSSGPRLLLLDEPTVGIDAAGQQRFAQMLSRVNTELGVTVMIVSHDLRAVAAGCDRVACLSRTLHFHDAPKGLTPAVLAEVFRHDVSGIFGDVHIDAHTAESCRDSSHAPMVGVSVSAPPAGGSR